MIDMSMPLRNRVRVVPTNTTACHDPDLSHRETVITGKKGRITS